MPTKYSVNLTEAERYQLLDLTKKGKNSSRKLKRAQILLLADEGHRDLEISDILKVGESTVHRTRQRYIEEGVSRAIAEKPRSGKPPKLTIPCVDAESVYRMEDLLSVYADELNDLVYEPKICFDERPVCLLASMS